MIGKLLSVPVNVSTAVLGRLKTSETCRSCNCTEIKRHEDRSRMLLEYNAPTGTFSNYHSFRTVVVIPPTRFFVPLTPTPMATPSHCSIFCWKNVYCRQKWSTNLNFIIYFSIVLWSVSIVFEYMERQHLFWPCSSLNMCWWQKLYNATGLFYIWHFRKS